MEIVTGSTGQVHVTPIDDAVRNGNVGYLKSNAVFDVLEKFRLQVVTNNLVRVHSGYGMMQGRLIKIDRNGYDGLTIENGTVGKKRSDLVVAHYEMNESTGFESVTLEVIRGSEGSEYTIPTYTTGNINEGATAADFPLYEVRINGTSIVQDDTYPKQLFTLLDDGGRIGAAEVKVDRHVADTENPHTIAIDPSEALAALNTTDTLKKNWSRLAKAVTTLISHIANKQNPHEVSGAQLSGVVPVSKGGTGATNPTDAKRALEIPEDIADAASLTYVNGRVPFALGKNASGQYGYYKEGASSVTPFRNPTGNATAAHVLAGKTFSSATLENAVGTMPEVAQYKKTVRAGYTLQEDVKAFVLFADITAERYHDDNTYTYPVNNTGGTVDLGVSHNYRRVNAQNVYSKGVTDADARVNTSSASYTRGKNDGIAQQKAVSWTQHVRLRHGNQIDCRNATNVKVRTDGLHFDVASVTLKFLDGFGGSAVNSYDITRAGGNSYAVPSTAKVLQILCEGNGGQNVDNMSFSSTPRVDLDITYNCNAH